MWIYGAMAGVNNLLIHHDPGTRGGMLAAWLQGNLRGSKFDVGEYFNNQINYHKIHDLEDVGLIQNFNGIRIRIKQDRVKLELSMYFYLVKNVYQLLPEFSKDQFDLDTWSKMFTSHSQWLKNDNALDYSLYNYVVNFSDLYNTNYMVDLYKEINQASPNDDLVNELVNNNKLNNPILEPYHSCTLAALVLNEEFNQGLHEQDRLWSIVDVYNTYPATERHRVLNNMLAPTNYKGM